jgi:hypothetical protein
MALRNRDIQAIDCLARKLKLIEGVLDEDISDFEKVKKIRELSQILPQQLGEFER